MKKMTILAAMAATAAMAMSVHELNETENTIGTGPKLAPSQIVAARAMSTNAAGTVTLKRISTHEVSWLTFAPVTNVLKEARTTVERRTVTNDVVTAWITNRVSATVVESNFWARAINETPTNHPYANMVYVTNRVEAVEDVTNIVSEVVVGTNVTLKASWNTATVVKTNDVATLALSGGFAETNLADVAMMPGDRLQATGTGMAGGKVLLMTR
jgi:hypothetical protein